MTLTKFDILMFSILTLIVLCVYLDEEDPQKYTNKNLEAEEIALINERWDNCTVFAEVFYKSSISNGKSHYYRDVRFVEVVNNKTKEQIQVPASRFNEEEFENMQGRTCSLVVDNYNFETKEYNLRLKSVDVLKFEKDQK
jgi:hypothetical protein